MAKPEITHMLIGRTHDGMWFVIGVTGRYFHFQTHADAMAFAIEVFNGRSQDSNQEGQG